MTRRPVPAEFSEIKHSEEAVPREYRHLIDEQKCTQTRAPLRSDHLRCRPLPWESQVIDGISYQNVEEYLRSLA